MRLLMGTRGSALALAQSGLIARGLEARHRGLAVETVIIKTSGDLFSAQSPKAAAEASSGGKGLFVKEIEEALAVGRVDFAVHSAKDLPGELAPGLCVAAYPEREDPRDAFIGREGLTWAALGGARLGTSSLRRKIQALRCRPGAEIVPMRGNVDTRLRKLKEGACDGLILAAAGLRRLGRADVPHELISTEEILPAPGQGALAVEAKSSRRDLLEVLGALDDPRTRREVEFERAFLAALGGGCSTPLGALARVAGPAAVTLTVFWSRADGSGAVRLSETCADSGQRDAFAARLAARIKSPF